MTTGLTGRLLARPALATALAAAIIALPSIGFAAQQATAPAQDTAQMGEEVVVLANAIRKDLETLPCTATTEDVEASIVFTLSQRNPAQPLIAPALDQLLLMKTCYGGQAQAVRRVRVALLNRRLNRGTAAIGGNGFQGSAAFSAPAVNVGGGSADYSN